MTGAPTEHDRFDYSAIVDRPRLRWPDGARVAVWVIPNIEHFLFDRPSTSVTAATVGLVPDVLNYSWRDYGVRVGIWRIIEAANQLGWEWMGHGRNNSILINKQPEDEERALIREVVETISKGTGHRPRGWLGPALSESHRTLDILAENGIDYVGDWVNDEQPYPMRVARGKMTSIPYSIELNDIPAFLD